MAEWKDGLQGEKVLISEGVVKARIVVHDNRCTVYDNQGHTLGISPNLSNAKTLAETMTYTSTGNLLLE